MHVIGGDTIRNRQPGRLLVPTPWMSASIAIGNISLPLQSVIHSSPMFTQPQNAAADYRADCRSCNDLQALIQDMFDEARSMHALINGCESSADAAVNANVRKAAGFHQLHELTVLKELHAKPPALSSTTATATATAMATAMAALATATATATATAPPPARAAGP